MGRLRWVGNGLRGHEYAVPEAWKHGGAIQLSGQATHAIIEEGPYLLSRNPLYVGMLALYLGLAVLDQKAAATSASGTAAFPDRARGSRRHRKKDTQDSERAQRITWHHRISGDRSTHHVRGL